MWLPISYAEPDLQFATEILSGRTRTMARFKVIQHVVICLLLSCLACRPGASGAQPPPGVGNSSGLRLKVAAENTQPSLRVLLPGWTDNDRSIEVLFPEHVTS